jgi:hypothetical protein
MNLRKGVSDILPVEVFKFLKSALLAKARPKLAVSPLVNPTV